MGLGYVYRCPYGQDKEVTMTTGFGLVKWPEAARLTGLSPNTLKRYVSQQKVPYVKVSKLVFFDPARLRKWIANKAVEPVERCAR